MTTSTTQPRPRVSVIVPFLNAERFIEETVDSVIAQTFANWELVLVDDGSTDNSPRMARAYARRFPSQIFCVTHDGHRNRGISASRNLGIKVSNAEYVAFLDADDLWLPEHLEYYVALMDRHTDAGAVFGRSIYWHSWNEQETDTRTPIDRAPPIGQLDAGKVLSPPQALVPMLLGRIAVPCPCAVMARRKAIELVNGFEEAFPGAYEDQVFYAKLFLSCKTVFADACLDLYRQHGESITATSRLRRTESKERRKFLAWLGTYVSAQGAPDSNLQRALKSANWRLNHPSLNRWRWKISRLIDRITKLHSDDPDIPQTRVPSFRDKQQAR